VPGVKSGAPKRGGRRAGTPNKASIENRTAILAYCQSIGVDPFRWMADQLAKDRQETRIKLACAEALADRLVPRLKSIEITGNAENPVHFLVEQLTPAERQLRQERLAHLLVKREVRHALATG
jgi:hypothetical protein